MTAPETVQAPPAAPAAPAPGASDRTAARVAYALQAASLLFVFPLLLAAPLSYLKRLEARGTWLESHFTWQIRTFWLSLLFGTAAFLAWGQALYYAWAAPQTDALSRNLAALAILAVFFLPLVFVGWYLYRVVAGWARLDEGGPMG
ncbi:MAG TPA: hypothetical protein VF263_06045 [Longimicrobiaceae bacterium]